MGEDMKYINCPNCGCKLFEGDEGTHIILKCSKCSKLFEVTVEPLSIVVISKSKPKETEVSGLALTTN